MSNTSYRQKCLGAKGRQCDDCGSEENIEVHHLDRDRSNNDLSNLLPLCHGCHMDRHYEERVERMSGPSGKRSARAGNSTEQGDREPADRAMLDLLQEGRVTAPYAAEEADYSLQYTRDVLGRLVEHGHARKVYEGLYELAEDPRHE